MSLRERPAQVQQALATIKEGQVKADSLRRQAGQQTDAEQLRGELSGRYSKLARSEQRIGQEQVTALETKISALRNWLFIPGHGHDTTMDPDYQQRIDEEGWTEEQARNRFSFNKDSLSVIADNDNTIPGLNFPQILQIISVDEPTTTLDFSFPNDVYNYPHVNLNINFLIDDSQTGTRFANYDYPGIRIPELTPDEYTVINYYLDSLTEQTIEVSPQDSAQ